MLHLYEERARTCVASWKRKGVSLDAYNTNENTDDLNALREAQCRAAIFRPSQIGQSSITAGKSLRCRRRCFMKGLQVSTKKINVPFEFEIPKLEALNQGQGDVTKPTRQARE